MILKREVSDDEVILDVSGALSGEPAGEFQRTLEALADERHSTITLNFAEVNSINSSCIGKILLYRKKLSEDGRTIKINGCSESLYSTFQLIKFDKLVPIER